MYRKIILLPCIHLPRTFYKHVLVLNTIFFVLEKLLLACKTVFRPSISNSLHPLVYILVKQARLYSNPLCTLLLENNAVCINVYIDKEGLSFLLGSDPRHFKLEMTYIRYDACFSVRFI